MFDNISQIDDSLWERGAQVHCVAATSAKARSCDVEGKFPLLALFPDQRQAGEFFSGDCGENRLFLNELPLSVEGISSRPLQLRRGETLASWRTRGGVLVATPGALLAPFLCGDGEISFKIGEEHGRERLVEWLEQEGYRRADIVWSPGQYVFRGLVLDVFDPVYTYPIRVEFFDETVESLRSFDPQTQKSAAQLEEIEIHSVRGAKKVSFTSQVPKGTRVLLFEPKNIETQAHTYFMFWNELCKEAGARENVIQSWDDVFLPLSTLPRLRITRAVEFSEARLVPAEETSPPTGGRRTAGWRMPDEWRNSLASGQVVVHEDYGIAIFRGVEEIVTSGEIMDALVLEFAQNQRLLLPVLQINKLTALPQHEGDDVVLDTLRGTKWKKSVAKAREQAEKEAREILEIFATREITEGFSFPPPGEFYENFAKAFPHIETLDQTDAIRDAAQDMSAPHPMDRLIVGDVGYGKTEVAMRAAVRAVEAGKQAAVLVPTTILAQQHGNSFKERTAGFPIRTEVLSRFVTKARQSKILDDVAAGKVDILIGTQRLLQKDIKFKDLGLLVIDEEHRLGVLHKEHLKQKYKNVDVLTLSATPIPRTLSLSLRGLRDISQLSTPPQNRLPVMTYSGAWQTSLVKRAITSELLRGGQIYFVANRVARIDMRLTQLKNFFPDAKIATAHGQMPSTELERVMLDFYEGKSDILLCTTIIESGLDVAHANTLIVDDSQELGLSQMYQLRGRVGRREESAFAYFFYPEGAALRKETVERLDAITRMTDLGSGYSLALQDLEIRGGGEFLGTSQHGKGELGGFHFFYKILEQEIEKIRGNVRREVKIDSEINGSIPTYYIPQESVRVTLYRRLLRTSTRGEIDRLRAEIIDRFGPIPDILKFLFDITLVRNVGASFGIEELIVKRGETVVKGNTLKIRALLDESRRWILPTIASEHAKATSPGGTNSVRALAEAITNNKGGL